ncbi:uncharacterized protein LOC135827382 isoform X2 [Sycon ciliatum]|uniref:uncharacterized protein LOC135827382 isoform X2 n=1 Tax=Sycon ciliatum TaxID=27933 RepID=UPI0031F67326
MIISRITLGISSGTCFPKMASLKHRSPQDILSGQMKKSVSQPNFSKTRTVDYSNVKSRCGSTVNASHKPGGGMKKIATAKVDFSGVESRTSSRHGNYVAGGGKVKIVDKPVKLGRVTSRIDSGKSTPHFRPSDVTPLPSCVSPTSSLTGLTRSKSESSSPSTLRHVQGHHVAMTLHDHEKVQEQIRKLSVEEGAHEESSTSPGQSPTTARKPYRKGPSSEKAVKLPLGLRRFASSTSSLSRPVERLSDTSGAGKRLTRHTSLDPARFRQAEERTISYTSTPSSAAVKTGSRLRKYGSASSGIGNSGNSRKSGLSSVSSSGFHERTTSLDEDRLGRDWIREQETEGSESAESVSAADLVTQSLTSLPEASVSENGQEFAHASPTSGENNQELDIEVHSEPANERSHTSLLSPIREASIEQGAFDSLQA